MTDVALDFKLGVAHALPTDMGHRRAAKIADLEVAMRKSSKGWNLGLMTPERRSKAGRKAKAKATE